MSVGIDEARQNGHVAASIRQSNGARMRFWASILVYWWGKVTIIGFFIRSSGDFSLHRNAENPFQPGKVRVCQGT